MPRKSTCNHSAFSPVDGWYTNEQLYWMGWLATDGCVHKRKLISNGVQSDMVSLCITDLEIIERFSKFLNDDYTLHPIIGNRKQAYRVSVSSNQISQDLQRVGIGYAKSKTLKVDEQLARSKYFWRGAIEGDGCISYHKKSKQNRVVFTSASLEFIKQFNSFYPVVSIQNRETYYQTSWHCAKASVLIYALYSGSGNESHLRLSRKAKYYFQSLLPAKQ